MHTYTRKHSTTILLFFGLLTAMTAAVSCSGENAADKMRREKMAADSLSLIRAKQTAVYSDSILNTLLPKADSLIKFFSYEKQENYEDHGYYTHRLLTTQKNTQRQFLQAQTDDRGALIVQSYYYGAKPIDHTAVRLEAGGVYAEAEGSRHSFEAEGVHEIVSIRDKDAKRLLEFVATHLQERIKVTAHGKQKAVYYLQNNEKEALRQTLELSLVMTDIATLENTIRVSNRQAETLERRLNKARERQISDNNQNK